MTKVNTKAAFQKIRRKPAAYRRPIQALKGYYALFSVSDALLIAHAGV